MLRLWTALLAAALIGSHTDSASAAPPVWFFGQTGHTLELGFAHFVGTHGGTAVTGLPLTEEIDEHGVVVQYFQHLRLEWHPDHPNGAQVVVGPLGLELHKQQPAVPAPSGPGAPTYFANTGHTLADGFLAFYTSHDGPRLLGTPITEELTEGGAVVQYFTNGELTWKPGQAVAMADLGALAVAGKRWKPNEPPLAAVAPPPGSLIGEPPGPGADGLGSASTPTTGSGAVLAGANGAVAARQQVGLGHLSVPVLMYHHIGLWPSIYSVFTANFAAQLDWLQANGYHAVTLREVITAMDGPGALPPNPVVISIDDGYSDVATNARQVLLLHHMTATFFIPTVQTPLSPAVLRQMDSEGFDIEAHSRTHPDLTRLGDAAAWSEIAGSKLDLEQTLGHPVTLFAYPYGAVNTHVASLVQQAGYRAGILASGGQWYSTTTAFYEPRILVDRGDDLANFIAKVQGRPYRDTVQSGSTPSAAVQNNQQPALELSPPGVPASPAAPASSAAPADSGVAPSPDSAGDAGSTGSGDPSAQERGAIYM